MTSVKVNGVAATFALVAGGTQLRLTVPPAATSGPVTVTNAGGTATSAATLSVLPKIAGFTPASGPTGTLVTINGSGFAGSSTVTFAGAAPVAATYVSATQIKAVVPSGATTGKPVVTTAAGASAPSTAAFTVTFAVTGFLPAGGAAGTVVTVTGTGFVAPLTVRFGGLNGTGVIIDSPTQLRATVPAGAQTGAITVGKPSATIAGANTFFVPRITSLAPAAAAVGESVVVSGAELVGPTLVLFGSAPAWFTADANTQVTAAGAGRAHRPRDGHRDDAVRQRHESGQLHAQP